ncbi:MAG: hypothetical protein LC808_37730, partial [Actinobacteria bacterium]|nr:hypothetical protein [Actinomycetota bacterium]
MSAISYGHAGKLAATAAGAQAAGGEKPAPPINPVLYRCEDVRRILAARDIAALYRVLKDDARVTQRMIAELTGQSQSEVALGQVGTHRAGADVHARAVIDSGVVCDVRCD